MAFWGCWKGPVRGILPSGAMPLGCGVGIPTVRSPVELCTQLASHFWTTEPVFFFFVTQHLIHAPGNQRSGQWDTFFSVSVPPHPKSEG